MQTPTLSQCEKRYNEIALNWLAGTEPDVTAADDLRSIAQTCLTEGGRAVLDARGLCAVWLKEYYDESNCNFGERSAEAANNMQTGLSPDLHIVPNPADDLVRVSLNLTMTEGKGILLEVFDLNGRKVYTATPTSENINIPVKGWPEGLYVIRVTAHNRTFSKTFVVQHR